MAQQSFVTSFNSNLQNFTTGTPYVINDTQYTQAQNPINALPVDKTGAVNTTIWANPSNFHVECDVTQYNSGLGYAGYPAGTVLSPPPVTLDGVNGTPLVCGWFTVNVTSSPDGRLGGAGAAGNTEQANITIAVNKTAGTPGTMNVALWQLPTGAGGPGGGGDNGNTYTGRVRIIYEPAPAGPPGLTQINPAALQSMDVPIQVTVAREPLLITPGPSNCVDGTTNCFETIVGTGPGFAFQCGSVSVPLAEYGTESYDIALQSSSSGIYTGIGPTAFTSPDPSGGACGNGANCTGSWLNIIGNDSTSFGGGNTALTCAINPQNLQPGRYTAQYDVRPAHNRGSDLFNDMSGPAGLSSRPMNQVTFILHSLWSLPTLTDAVTGLPSTGLFLFTVGGPNPHNQILTITNAGPFGTITGLSVQFVQGAVPAGANPNWLNLSTLATTTLAPGSSTQVTLSIPQSVLNTAVAGDYFGTIIVTSNNSTPTTINIPVHYNTVGLAITIQPGVLHQFSYQHGCASTTPGTACDPSPQNLSVNLTSLFNQQDGQLTITPSSVGNWLQINNGTVEVGPQPVGISPIGFQVSVSTTALNLMTPSNVPYTGTLTIHIPGAPNDPVVLNVSVLLDEEPTLNVTTGATLPFQFVLDPNNPGTPVNVGVGQATYAATTSSGTAGFTAGINSNSNWLRINAGSSISSPGTVDISNVAITTVNSADEFTLSPNIATVAGLAGSGAGTQYHGTLTVTSPGVTAGYPGILSPAQPEAVNLIVYSTPHISATPTGSTCEGGTVAAPCFTSILASGTASPNPRTVNVTSDSALSTNLSVSFSNSQYTYIAVPSVLNWTGALNCNLGASSVSSNAPTTLTCAVDPNNALVQNPGTYTTTVTVNPTTAPAVVGAGNPFTLTYVVHPAFTLTGATLLANNTLVYDFVPGNNLQPLVQTVNLGALVGTKGGLSYSSSIVTTCPATVPVACSTLSWLGVSPAAGTTPQALMVTVNPSVVSVGTPPNLDARYDGDYTATITIHSLLPSPTAADAVINVTFHVGRGCLLVSPNVLSFTLINGVTGPVTPAPSQPITFTVCAAPNPGIGFQATLVVNTPSGANWVTLANTTGTTDANGHGTVTVQLNPPVTPNFLTPTTGAALYSAVVAIQFNTSLSPIVIPVSLQVAGQPQQVVTPGSFTFPNHTIGVTTPGSQSEALTTATVPVPVPFVATPLAFTATPSVSPGEKCGANWLSVSPPNGTTTGTSSTTILAVGYTTAGFADDQTDYTCHGNILVSTPGASTPAISYSVTLNVLRRPSIFTNLPPPASLTFSLCGPPSATFTVSATNGNALAITHLTAATILANQGWLSVTPDGGTTPQTFTVTMTLGTLNPGTFDGNIIIVAPQAANSPLTIPVTVITACPLCSFTINTPPPVLPNGSGTFNSLTGNFTVTPSGLACSSADTWTANKGADSLNRGLYWVTSINPASGNGSAPTPVNFTVFTTTTTAIRTGVINVQSTSVQPALAFTITQSGSTETLPQREVRSLYQTTMLREPDQGGFEFWTTTGAGALYQMADDFYISNEFLQTGYMAGAIYSAVLGRVSTQTEWIAADAILRPANTSVADIQAAQDGIIDQLLASAEYAADIGTGTPTDTQFLNMLYQTALGRSPDPGGFTFWHNLLSNGSLTRSEVVRQFIGSADFQSRTNPLYITLLYYTILVRTPDAGGLAFWVGTADQGGNGILFLNTPQAVNTRYTILGMFGRSCGFLGSAEWQGLLLPGAPAACPMLP